MPNVNHWLEIIITCFSRALYLLPLVSLHDDWSVAIVIGYKFCVYLSMILVLFPLIKTHSNVSYHPFALQYHFLGDLNFIQ